MRRCHLRGRDNILKRQSVHVGAFNLSLILRQLLGAGTPRELRNRSGQLVLHVLLLLWYGNGQQPCRSSRISASATKYDARPRTQTAPPALPKISPFHHGLLDTFEASTINPLFWTQTQQYGTVRLSTDVDKTVGGSQSLKFSSVQGGQRGIGVSHRFASPQKGTFSIWFYDVAPGQETQYEQISLYNSVTTDALQLERKTSMLTATKRNCITTPLRSNRVPTKTAGYTLRFQRRTYIASLVGTSLRSTLGATPLHSRLMAHQSSPRVATTATTAS
jgi:hypothetical protein